jgi:hypothetical protein
MLLSLLFARLARRLLEVWSHRRWSRTFAASQDFLGELADKALADYRAGRTESLDVDRL